MRRWLLLILLSLLTGCVGQQGYAPVVSAWQQPAAKSGFYRVKQGDTLYSIAWGFGLDFRALAKANQLSAPYEIHPGQTLRMTTVARKPWTRPSSQGGVKRAKALPQAPSQPAYQPPRLAAPVKHWIWPARGRVVATFKNTLAGNKGIDIKGKFGEPVRATAPGVVVYSGDGLRGYGNLIIIKHNDSYLSAYAFNQRNMVRLNQRVQRGQQIATMGRNNAGKVLLHFEIRRNGRPVNPMTYLQ